MLIFGHLATEKVNISRVKKGGVNYTSSILGVAFVLLVLGILGWIIINARNVSNAFKESVQISVEFNDETREDLAKQLEKVVKEQNFSKSVKYISKDQAAQDWKSANGENFNEVLDYNPLYSSLLIHLKSNYINKDSLLNIEKFLKQSNIVREVDIQQNLVDVMTDKMRRIGIIFLVIGVILVLLVVLLIDNTIRLAMYSNRFLIKTMQFVGATRLFIARPFIVRSLINGLISGILAILGVILLKGWAETLYPELSAIKNGQSMLYLYIGIMLLGLIISVISTYRSVIKYLKTSLDDLY
jgi:cell division transport system permease protein